MTEPIMNVLGLSNAITETKWCTNPFVTNTLMICSILKRLGYYVRFFGAEGSTPECDEMHAVVEKKELQDTYGDKFFQQALDWNTIDAEYAHELFETRAKKILKELTKPGEFLLSLAGPRGSEPVQCVISRSVQFDCDRACCRIRHGFLSI